MVGLKWSMVGHR